MYILTFSPYFSSTELCITEHNKFRRLHKDTEPLKWDLFLGLEAQRFARYLANNIDLVHGSLGENLFVKMGSNGTTKWTCQSASKAWWDRLLFNIFNVNFAWIPFHSISPSETIKLCYIIVCNTQSTNRLRKVICAVLTCQSDRGGKKSEGRGRRVYLKYFVFNSRYSEVKHYDYSTEASTNNHSVEHFKQMVWKKARRVGVGIAVHKSLKFVYLVARYDAPIMVQEIKENVMPEYWKYFFFLFQLLSFLK